MAMYKNYPWGPARWWQQRRIHAARATVCREKTVVTGIVPLPSASLALPELEIGLAVPAKVGQRPLDVQCAGRCGAEKASTYSRIMFGPRLGAGSIPL